MDGKDGDQQAQKTHTDMESKSPKRIVYLDVTVATYNVTFSDMYNDYGNNEPHQQHFHLVSRAKQISNLRVLLASVRNTYIWMIQVHHS